MAHSLLPKGRYPLIASRVCDISVLGQTGTETEKRWITILTLVQCTEPNWNYFLTSLFEQQIQSLILLGSLVNDERGQIHVGPKVYEQLDVLPPAAVAQTHLQHRLWLLYPGQHLLVRAVVVGVGPVEKEQFEAVQVSVNSADIKGPPAGGGVGGPFRGFGLDVHLGSEAQQLPEHVQVALPGRGQGRGAVVVLAAVGIGPGLQQRHHTVQMFPIDSCEQRRLRLHVQAVDLDSDKQYINIL